MDEQLDLFYEARKIELTQEEISRSIVDDVDTDDNNEYECGDLDNDTCNAVSYTHLTRPTNREV